MEANQDSIQILQEELEALQEKALKGELKEEAPALVLADHDLETKHGIAEKIRHNPARVEAASMVIDRVDERYGGGMVLALLGAGLNHPIDQEEPDEAMLWSFDKTGKRMPSEGCVEILEWRRATLDKLIVACEGKPDLKVGAQYTILPDSHMHLHVSLHPKGSIDAPPLE